MRAARHVLLLLISALMSVLPARSVRGEAVDAEEHVVLKSGRVLAGRVISKEKIHGKSFLVVDTPFGEMRIPERIVRKEIKPPLKPEGTIRMRTLRVVRIEGKVERKPADGTDWYSVRWTDAYKKPIVNGDNAIIRPGDTIRTHKNGTLDFQPNKEIWIRIGKNSLVEIPAVDAAKGPSLELRKGRAHVDVVTRVPSAKAGGRGGTFRVRTPITTLSTRDGRFEAREDGATILRGAVEGEGERLPPSKARTYAYGKPIQRLPLDDMCFVPAGRYKLGGEYAKRLGTAPSASDASMLLCKSFSHRITEPFLIDRRETTNQAFRAYLTARGKPVPSIFAVRKYPPQRPYVFANRDEAEAQAAWAGKQLPTEEQWEAAARGPRGKTFPWGSKVEAVHRELPLQTGVQHIWYAGRDGKQAEDRADERPKAASKGARNPYRLLGVDEPTQDISPFGVEAMVTSTAEWTRSTLGNPVYWRHLEQEIAEDRAWEPVLRGVSGQTAMRVSGHWKGTQVGGPKRTHQAGIRGVLELGE